jgi:hypothetical protein
MARTFYDSCDECGNTFSSRTIIGAQSQARVCYENHFPVQVRDTKEIMDDIKREIPDWDGGK